MVRTPAHDARLGANRAQQRWIKPIRDVFLQSNNTVLAEARKKYAPNPPPAPESYDDPIFVALVEENAKANARNVISDPVVRQVCHTNNGASCFVTMC